MNTHTIKLINDIEEDQYQSDLQICKMAFTNYFNELEEQRTEEMTRKYLKNSAVVGVAIFTFIIIMGFIW